MVDQARARRLEKRIAAIVASAIEREIKDPGLDGVTIVDAKVTADLHDATVFYTVMGPTLNDEPDFAGAAAALDRAKGTLRTKVGAGTGVRFTPDADVQPGHDVGYRAANGRAAGPRPRRRRRRGAGPRGRQAGGGGRSIP